MSVTSENTLKSINKSFLLNVEYNFLKYGPVPCSYVRNVYFIMTEKPMGRRLIGKPKCRWQGNIKTKECPGRS
jgi:hypothetical protein